MTDEEKKEYRDKLVEDCMKYNHIDYDDDKDIVETMVEAIASEELMELIPNFDPWVRQMIACKAQAEAIVKFKPIYD